MKSFHLKWASHLPNMGSVFASLYQSEGLSDVSLACTDGSLRAHKLLLSTCSDYFLDLFLECQTKRTVVMLPGVRVADLKVLLHFIYTGEVRVSEEGLADLLQVAEMLGVRGLRADQEEGEDKQPRAGKEAGAKETPLEEELPENPTDAEAEADNPCPAEPVVMKEEPMAPPPEELKPAEAEKETDADGEEYMEEEGGEEEEEEEVAPAVKSEPARSLGPGVDKAAYPGLQSQYGYMAPYMSPLVSMSNLAAMYQQQQQQQQQAAPVKEERKPDVSSYGHPLDHYRQVSEGGQLPLDLLPDDVNAIMAQSTEPTCPICSKDCTNFPNLRSHLQVHNSIRPYACTFCEAKFARVSHLNRHIRTHTGERPFGCDRCGKSFARQDKLKLHMDRHLGLAPPGRETPGPASKAELLGLLSSGGLGTGPSAPGRKAKQEQPGKPEPPAPLPPSPYSSLLAGPAPPPAPALLGPSSASLWGGFPLYQQHQAAPYQPIYPGMMYPGMGQELPGRKLPDCGLKQLGGT